MLAIVERVGVLKDTRKLVLNVGEPVLLKQKWILKEICAVTHYSEARWEKWLYELQKFIYRYL